MIAVVDEDDLECNMEKKTETYTDDGYWDPKFARNDINPVSIKPLSY